MSIDPAFALQGSLLPFYLKHDVFVPRCIFSLSKTLCCCDWQLTDDDVIGVDAAGSSPASIKRVQSLPASKQAQMSQ